MSISADFTVNSSSNPATHTTTYGATVNLALTSISGATSIVWRVIGTSHIGDTEPTITPGGSPSGATASFPFMSDPGGGEGRSVLIECEVSDGKGTTVRSRAVVGVPNDNNTIVPIAAGEKFERGTHGWGSLINTLLNA